ncbi:MAG TPA: hypothetical protein VI814_10115 [Candidatus Limnocylindria bacterium]
MPIRGRILSIGAALSLSIALLPVGSATAAAPWNSGGVTVLEPVASDVGPSLSRSPRTGAAQDAAERVMELKSNSGHGKPGGGGGGGSTDGALQTSATLAPATVAGNINRDGVGVGINGTYKDCCTPPDTNLAVGTTQVVQWVNVDFAVFDKTTGALLSGPQKGNTIWSGFQVSACATNNDGDPIVKFDAQNQRWLMTQFSVSTQPYLQCVAISSSADFLNSSWYRYAYNFGTEFPDYPKVGIWPDAYYFSMNLFHNGATFSGADACALDSASARAGLPNASMQCINSGSASLLPADLDGATGATATTQLPPAGAAGYFMSLGSNALNLWRMHVNFADSTQTTLTGPTSFATAAFSQACGGGTCVPQAGTSQTLDTLADRLMYRLSYRNFGGYESLVVNHSAKGSGTSAPRWYELRNTGAGYAIAQQSSYAPDTTYRWMGSAAQDKQGNLAIGYSASSGTISPDIRYAGRLASDPAGQLRQEVAVGLPTRGSETGPYSRWGDYSSMTLDPSDDCTFWYTTMYYKATGGSFTWSTRMVNFKFSGCS